ncbi:hypothetical protein DSO57_1008320 [Entomophthora muscae]|uniref:Uncharacterized protein n=1 Tax=Entomophthora muscae TaxID=34485 RepID=A0ACC2RLX5_9FUNG|nr:hypothetical protein DSO57_1008320 [Entomophthora muscae]
MESLDNGNVMSLAIEDSSTSWEKVFGPSMLILNSSVSLFLNLLIVIGTLRAKNLRTLGSFLALQMAFLDLIFSIWGIGWFGLKMIYPTYTFTSSIIQIEAAVLHSGFFAWLASALLLTFHSYLEKTSYRPTRKFHKTLIWIQYFLWVLPIIVCIILGADGLFDIMPSGSYCGSLYSPGSLSSQITSIGFLFAICLPSFISAYFYSVILSNKSSPVRELIEPPDPVYLPRGFSFYQASTASLNKLKKGVSGPSFSQHRTALLVVAYPLMFFISFLPSAIVVLIELIYDSPRSTSSDAVVFGLSTLYKIAAPVFTIRTHSTVRNQVKLLLRISLSPNQSPEFLSSP